MSYFRMIMTGATIATIALSSTALAGGFQRGTADTDILYEPGTFNMRTGVTYISPQRGYESVNGVGGDFGDFTGNYTIPSYSVGFGGDMFGCAGTYTESFAATADYTDTLDGALPRQVSSTQSTSNADRLNFAGATSTSRTRTIGFDSNEFGLTCRVSYTADIGRFSLLGGVFAEDFSFEGSSYGNRFINGQVAQTGPSGQLLVGGLTRAVPGAQITVPSLVEVDSQGGYKAGYRVGFAYEKPEIALRAQVLYRSEVEHDNVNGTGTVTITDTAYASLNGQAISVPIPLQLGINAAGAQAGLVTGRVIDVESSLNTAISPQSLTINAQTGIAEGTLLIGSFRWTDWSTNKSVVSTIYSPQTGESSSYSPYNWRDGYTASIGIGRAFNEQISGAIALGYDRGVSTGSETTYTDLYTVAGGVSFKANKWSELRFGGVVGYWTDGDQSISDGAYFDGSVGEDLVIGGNASFKFTF
ncbi:long-chain fatty acid transporter [Aurantimonas aggregata]|uniref:Long-chain fatty acid transporter n=1 Tax=Aurantimonas aggregata TaxID=2047720 RepID=A0A6L9MBS5_9HYPH|nr:long-chain fatty acid transporter [Aurantimonas aggregata]NDV85131.1 long-chain fatty acid transporter [Aurantimonas aggregata]